MKKSSIATSSSSDKNFPQASNNSTSHWHELYSKDLFISVGESFLEQYEISCCNFCKKLGTSPEIKALSTKKSKIDCKKCEKIGFIEMAKELALKQRAINFNSSQSKKPFLSQVSNVQEQVLNVYDEHLLQQDDFYSSLCPPIDNFLFIKKTQKDLLRTIRNSPYAGKSSEEIKNEFFAEFSIEDLRNNAFYSTLSNETLDKLESKKTKQKSISYIFDNNHDLYSGKTTLQKLEETPFLKKSFPCYSAEQATSSLDLAYSLYKQNELPEWTSVLVASQSAGRGQVGRTWTSPKGNIYAAIRLPKRGLFSSHTSAPIIGGAIVQALRNIFLEKNPHLDTASQPEFLLKWTNDIIIKHCNDYFKVGGILLEEKNDCLLCGIGLNINSAPSLSDNLDENALKASYFSHFFNIEDYTINSIWQRLVYSIYLCYLSRTLEMEEAMLAQNVLHARNPNFSSSYADFCIQSNALLTSNNFLAFKNAKVSICEALILEEFDYDANNSQITEYTGILREISLEKDSLGALIVDTSLGRRSFISGRVRPL